MNAKPNKEKPDRYTYKKGTRRELKRILAEFNAPERPSCVFNRTPESFGKCIDNDLMFLLTDSDDGSIKMTAAVHVYPVTAQVDEHTTTTLNFAEIGSIWGTTPAPAGFRLDLAYSACVLETLRKAHDLCIQCLVTQVTESNPKGVDSLLALNEGWHPFNPKNGVFIKMDKFRESFEKTIPDEESRNKKLLTFSTPVKKAAPQAARSMLGIGASKFGSVTFEEDRVTAYDSATNKMIEIDIKFMPQMREVAQKVLSWSNCPQNRIGPDNGISWLAASKALTEFDLTRIPNTIRVDKIGKDKTAANSTQHLGLKNYTM